MYCFTVLVIIEEHYWSPAVKWSQILHQELSLNIAMWHEHLRATFPLCRAEVRQNKPVNAFHRSTGQRDDPDDSVPLPSSFSPIRTLIRAGMNAAVRSATDDFKLVGSVIKHAVTQQLQGWSSEWRSHRIWWLKSYNAKLWLVRSKSWLLHFSWDKRPRLGCMNPASCYIWLLRWTHATKHSSFIPCYYSDNSNRQISLSKCMSAHSLIWFMYITIPFTNAGKEEEEEKEKMNEFLRLPQKDFLWFLKEKLQTTDSVLRE